MSSSWLQIALFGLLVTPALAERPVINDAKAPAGPEDLKVIQSHLKQALPKARDATVCIQQGDVSGTGVIVSRDGLIMTAAHVTTGVGMEYDIVFEDGRKVKAESLGLDSETDAALMRITKKGKYPFVEIERDDRTQLGDWVFALGHSGGFDKERGSVVRLGRLVRISDNTYQSDCSLIGGDSGGPLFDLDGKLIAIHSRVGNKLPENMHVPTHVFLKSWDKMLKGEFLGDGPFAKRPEKGKGFLGFLAEAHDGEGLKVKRVGRESPAETAGIKKGDVILTMDGNKLESRDTLQKLMEEKAPTDKVTFEVLRDGKIETLTFRLGDRDA